MNCIRRHVAVLGLFFTRRICSREQRKKRLDWLDYMLAFIRSRSASRSKSPRKRRSPSPKTKKLCVNRLSRNVTRDHIVEIFSVYGKVASVDLPTSRNFVHPGYAYVEYEEHADCEKAMRHMNGGQIDGQEVLAQFVLDQRKREVRPRKISPQRRRPSWRRSPPRRSPVRRSPPRRSPPRRSPVRRSPARRSPPGRR